MYYILYKTTNLINDKFYIGIHQTKNLNDNYLGSGTVLNHSIKKYGKENFKREIIKLCNSYQELIELEKEYVNEEFLADKNNYNLKTGGGNFGILSKESRNKISETLKRKYKAGEIKSPNHNKGRVVSEDEKLRISKTLKEKYKNQSHPTKGTKILNREKSLNTVWNKGTKGLIKVKEETKIKTSNTLKERYKSKGHHLKGTTPWNKGIKSDKPAWNKGIKTILFQCPHCMKQIAGLPNAKRWHFDNCKLKSSTNTVGAI